MRNCLSSHIVGSNVSEFIGLKHGAHNLNSNVNRHIIYTYGADIAGTKLLWCMYGNEQFGEHIICNGLELFVDDDHARAVSDSCSISCILFTLLGVDVNWKVGKQPCIVTPYTNSEVHAFCIVTKIKSISLIFYNFLASSLLNLSVAWRIVKPLLISSRLIKSTFKQKLLRLTSVI